jgi:hypothetical protein
MAESPTYSKADEDAFPSLIDEKEISARRSAAEHKYRDFTSDQIDYFRRRCKTDLFFLATGPLEYDLLSINLHRHLTGWIQDSWGAQNRLLLLPRGHYKSTICTIADGIQMALPNCANVQQLPYSYGENTKILLAHEVKETAAKFLFEITAAFTRKELMLALFPECIPSKRTQRINKWELELPRTQHHKEPTFATIGASGAAQGGHYYWLKLDDLIGEDARDSTTVMGRILDWFDNVNSLLTRFAFDGWDLIGTRWAYNDVYSHAMQRYGLHIDGSDLSCIDPREVEKYEGGLLHTYARGAIERGVPIFPEEFTLEKLNVLRKNKLVWAAQYANNPLESGLNEFNWPLKYYNVDSMGNLVIFSGEDSYRRKINELNVVVLCDPSMGETNLADETGIVVVGVDSKHNIYILETVKERLKPPALVDTLFRLNNKYRPGVIAIEEVNFSGIYKYWIEEKANATQTYLPIRSYKPGSQRSKDGRIRGLAHFFSAGQVYCHEMMHDFRDEYEQFPMTSSKHLLDALAQGPQFWRRALNETEVVKQKEKIAEIMAERSALTGY